MAKKSTVKVRLVPEEKTDSKFYYYAKKPTSGLKAKDKLRKCNGEAKAELKEEEDKRKEQVLQHPFVS